jgi:hypothetical protein
MAIAARRKYTSRDFVKFPDDGNRHEAIEGEWVMTPPPNTDPHKVVHNLALLPDLELAVSDVFRRL